MATPSPDENGKHGKNPGGPNHHFIKQPTYRRVGAGKGGREGNPKAAKQMGDERSTVRWTSRIRDGRENRHGEGQK
ncbi:hypothetical protein ZHAS_00014521 [Anopheles sinensis]|uniref:Uncharacterized protein n=1 Tax=Anopheles sinensis TaxID=74873 RepID=A0A084W8I4_ANOSI|nr:hypothetical protein ZHAS_00014521 [Anopheles sinensis]